MLLHKDPMLHEYTMYHVPSNNYSITEGITKNIILFRSSTSIHFLQIYYKINTNTTVAKAPKVSMSRLWKFDVPPNSLQSRDR